MASYYRKLSSGIKWFYKFDMNGKTYRSQCIYLSKREAQQAERLKYSQLDEERRFGKQEKPIPLSTAITDRIKFLEVKYSLGHKVDSEHYLNLFKDFIGDPDIRDITRKDVESFLISYSELMTKKGLDNYQVNASIKSIKSLFNFIIDSNELIIKNPCKGIKPFPVSKKLKYIPSDEEIDFIRTKFNRRQLLLFNFVYDTVVHCVSFY